MVGPFKNHLNLYLKPPGGASQWHPPAARRGGRVMPLPVWRWRGPGAATADMTEERKEKGKEKRSNGCTGLSPLCRGRPAQLAQLASNDTSWNHL